MIVVYFQEEMEINLHGKIYSKYLNFPSCSSTGTRLIINVFDCKQQHSNLYMCYLVSLKGPKREIFVAGIFAQIRPIWIGDLGTRPKKPRK
jgi:hypothetical protein